MDETSAYYGDDGEYWIARSSRATTRGALQDEAEITYLVMPGLVPGIHVFAQATERP
jgi:hypothetical protein